MYILLHHLQDRIVPQHRHPDRQQEFIRDQLAMIRFVVGNKLITSMSPSSKMSKPQTQTNLDTVRNAYSGLQIDGIGVINKEGVSSFLTKSVVSFRPLIVEREYGAREKNGIMTIVLQKKTPGEGQESYNGEVLIYSEGFDLSSCFFSSKYWSRQTKDNSLTAARYINQVLQPHIVQHFARYQKLFQHSNARVHMTRATKDILEQNNFRVMPWPALNQAFKHI